MTPTMRSNLRALLFAATAASALSAYGVCNAADAAPAPVGAGAAAPAATSGVSDIVVTAQHRNESVQKVPMTIQALTGKTLSVLNVTTFDDLLKFTPNVSYGNNGAGQGEIYMRGLSAGFRGNQSSATVGNFPNVALFLDNQSMQFPARNLDIYLADMDRVEVLEGPQGTLFGGSAEAGAVRYITNKPTLNVFSGNVEVSAGLTVGGGPNGSGQATLNIPIVQDKLAIRAVVYDDHQGGYIDNVRSTFTRSNADLGNFYFGITPTAGKCPNGLPAGAAGFCAPPNSGQVNNFKLAKNDFNPLDYSGGRVELLYDINNDWDILIAESLQSMVAAGLSVDYPVGSEFQQLKPWQITSFVPSWDKDRFENTAWTVNGKIGPLKAIYTGGYTVRNISQQMDYTNYSRTVEGAYYECTGGSTGWGGSPFCFSPVTNWQDTVRSTHLSNEVRISSPDDWRLRFIAGGYEEQFRIYDVMNFQYKTIPSCTATNLAIALGGGQPCVADVRTAPGSTANDPGVRGNNTAFGEDTQRGYDQTAVFGSVDYDVIPNVLTISAGTRWYQYNEFEVGSQYATNTSCLNVPNGECTGGMTNINAAHDRVTYTGFKSRASITWHVNSDTLAYFLFSEGFRPGGYNRSIKAVIPGPGGVKQFEEPNGYGPDSLNNYEIGLKTQLFDHRLQLNLSAYYMQWNNVQFLLFNPPLGINTTFGINGPSYDVKGIEAQITGRITENFTVWASGSYNDDTQSNSPCLKGNIPGAPSFGECITQTTVAGSPGLVPFANPFGTLGSVPAFSPTFQGTIRARYDFQIADYRAFVMADANYTGSMFNQPATYPSGNGVLIPNTTYLRYLQPAYSTFDASIGIAKDKWYAELYGTNLSNSSASTFTSSAQFIKSEVPLRPLVVGLKVGANF